MKITIHPQGKFTRLEDGLYVDEKGNHYHEERVLRYKVLRQRTDETNKDVWQLYDHEGKIVILDFSTVWCLSLIHI